MEGSAEYETYADNLLLIINMIILMARIYLYYLHKYRFCLIRALHIIMPKEF